MKFRESVYESLPFYISKGVTRCNIIYNYDTMCSSVICWCDCSESFLTSGVPNLKLNSFTIQFYGSDFEINSDGTDVALGVSVVGEPQKETRFSYAGVPNKQKLKQIITEITKKNVKSMSHSRYQGESVQTYT